MRLEVTDVSVEVEGLRSPIASPILQIVPGVRPVQGQDGPVGILEIVGVTGSEKWLGDL